MDNDTASVELSRGGLPARMEVLTTEGPLAVAGLEVGDEVYALNASSKILKPKPVTNIELGEYSGPLIHADARRIDWLLHPDQRVPYRTAAIDRVRFQRAGDLDELGRYHLVTDWRTPDPSRFETVDVTDFSTDFEACISIDCHGHTFRAALPEGCEPTDRNGFTGYHFDGKTFKRYQDTLEELGSTVTIRDQKGHWRRPYQFDGDDFIRFIGWFVTEGSLTQSTNRDSTTIAIAQKTPSYRERIKALFERMGIDVQESKAYYGFSSNFYARLLARLCGEGCSGKHLPNFVWDLPTEQQELLLQVLVDGDGNDWEVYYTSSRQLVDDVLRLCVVTGRKPRYTFQEDRGMWRIYVGRVNDQLHPSSQVSRMEGDRRLYRLSVDDYSLVFAGRNGRFQWVSVSAVS